MIIFEEKIQLKEQQKLFLVPFGDVHYNTKDCDKARFHRLIEWVMRTEDAGNVVKLVGMGDYTDPMSSSERAAIKAIKGGSGAHDTTLSLFDEVAADMAYRIGTVLMPIKHSIIGLVEGHHFMEFYTDDVCKKGNTNTQFLASFLGTKYLGTVGLGRISLPHALQLDILVYHGKGNGGLATRVKAGKGFPGANVILMGHDHTKVVGCDQGLVIDPASPDGIASVKRYYIGTGSFLKGYVAGRETGSYVEQALMAPNELGVSMIELTIEKRNGRWRKDYHASI